MVVALYVTSGNMCGYSAPNTGYGCEQVIYKTGFESVMAEIAHIVGLNPRSCRYRDDLTAQERNCNENLILLCPTHHDLVDRVQCGRHTEEVMRAMKQKQERANDSPPLAGTEFERVVAEISARVRSSGWAAKFLSPAASWRAGLYAPSMADT